MEGKTKQNEYMLGRERESVRASLHNMTHHYYHIHWGGLTTSDN